jgi:hypothetical protein
MIEEMIDKHSKALADQAKLNPDGWVYEIDWPYGDDEYVPPEAVKGAWKVDPQGQLTDEFQANPNYRAVRKAKRAPRDYMLRVAEADARSPSYSGNEWVVETDPAFDDTFPNTPPEGLIGSWFIGPDGKFTGDFRPNPAYRGDMVT